MFTQRNGKILARENSKFCSFAELLQQLENKPKTPLKSTLNSLYHPSVLDCNTSWGIFASSLLVLWHKCDYKKQGGKKKKGGKRGNEMIINLVLDLLILCFVCPWTADPVSDEPVPEQMVFCVVPLKSEETHRFTPAEDSLLNYSYHIVTNVE